MASQILKQQQKAPHFSVLLHSNMIFLLLVLGEACFGQTAPIISTVATSPNIYFDSTSVALAPGSSAAIIGANLADSTASAAAPGQPKLGGVEVRLVDASCKDTGCELVASLLYASPTRIDFIVPGIPDITRVWRTRIVVLKNAQRFDGLTAADRVLIDAVYLESSPNPAVTAQPVTFTAHVPAMQGDPASPYYLRTGTVTFMDGDTPLGMVNLSNVITYTDEPPLRRYAVSFTTSKLAPGKHSIRADYSGDYSNFPKSSGTIVQAVSVPEVNIASIPNPTVYGQTAAIVVTVSPSTCTGTVAIFDASAPASLVPPPFSPLAAESGKLATVTLDRGRAVFSTQDFVVGNHPIYVKYSGDANCAPLGYAPANDFEYRTINHVVVPD